MNLGVFGERQIKEGLHLMSELSFSQQGANGDGIKINYSYINLPILLKLKTTSGSFYVGPQAGLLINATEKENGEKQIVTARVNNLDFSGVAGFVFPASEKLSYEFRFSYSLNSTDKQFSGDLYIPNVVMSLSLNYLFK